jgi:iron-sulfur cluster repair protein YtfE (RIC family)
MDAIGMLEKDHKDAKRLMDEISLSIGPQKKKLFEGLKRALETHDELEESIFYPTVLAHPKTSSFPVRDKEAHQVVEKALEQLAIMPMEGPDWARAFDAMKEKLLKHVADEEQVLFIKIREVLSATELVELGDKMKATRIDG